MTPESLAPDLLAPAPIVPAGDRCLSVDEAFVPLLPDRGLRRGHVVGCAGPAAVSLAVGLAVRPVAAGSWMAVVGFPMLGIEALAAMGVPLERVVAVDGGSGPRDWAERTGAAVDGFEVVLTRPPVGAERFVHKIRHRLQAKGAVLIPVGPMSPGVPCDLELVTTSITWSGVDHGAGHLRRRRATIRSGGRRMPRPIEVELLVPGNDGRVVSAADVDSCDLRQDPERDDESAAFLRAG